MHLFEEAMGKIFHWIVPALGPFLLLITFLVTIGMVIIAISPLGRRRLSEEKPEYTTFQWVSMIVTSGLGAATIYWAFTEWSYYIKMPGLDIVPESLEAERMSAAYAMFHWGFSAWALYTLAAVPLAYFYYKDKKSQLTYQEALNIKRGLGNGAINGLIVLGCCGGMTLTLSLAIPLVTDLFAKVTGLPSGMGTSLAIVGIVAVVYSFSGYLGIERGMRRIADFNIKLTVLFCAAVILLGPTQFIIDNTINSFGLMLGHFVEMSLYTAPGETSAFPENWTMFYWFYWLSYGPFTGIFIAKISKGRTVGQMILVTLFGGSGGCILFFGIMSSLSLSCYRSETVDLVKMIESGSGNEGVIQILETLPGGWIFVAIFCIMSLSFLSATMNSAAFSLAETTSRGKLRNGETPPLYRLFWCVVLTVVPMFMIFLNADLVTLKSVVILSSIPFFFVAAILLFKWISCELNLIRGDRPN